MRLKQFILHGFKSFANKTVLKFGEGIVVIVGPNGCGKSNIADAMKWVTGGVRSAKSMRSQSMTDVIFSGAATRPALNMAEVSMVLSDVGDVLDTEYNDVTITRRIYRSGESQYLINKNLVRKKDIEDLLSGSGVGRSSISIFEQGKIDQIIYITPEERREILEEVAGISKFIQRKKDTLRNLEKTEENLLRVQDILTEVEKQMKTAERQAEKAAVYKEKSELLERLDKALMTTKWRLQQEKLSSVETSYNGIGTLYQEVATLVQAEEKALHEARLLVEEREAVLGRKKESLYETKNKKELQEQEIRVNAEKFQEAADKEKSLGKEIAELNERQQEWKKVGESLSATVAVEMGKLEEALAELDVKKELAGAIEAELGKKRQVQKEATEKRMALIQIETKAESDWKQTKFRLEHFFEKKDRSKLRLSQLEDDLKNWATTFAAKKEELGAASLSVDQKKAELDALDSKKKELEEGVSESEVQLRKFNQTITEMSAREKALLRIKEEMHGFSRGTKELVKQFKGIQSLVEVLSLDEKLASATTAMMRPYAQTLVVQNEEEFKAVIAYAEQKGLSDYSILIKGSEGEFFSKVHIVPSREEALKQFDGASEFCTEGKEYLDRRRVLFFSGKEAENAFVREAELKTLKKEIASHEEERGVLQKKLVEMKAQLQAVTTARQEQDKQLRKEEMKLIEMNFSVQKASQEIEKGNIESETLKKEIEVILQGIAEHKSNLVALEETHTKAKEEAAKMAEENRHQEVELEKLVASYNAAKEELSAKQTAYRAVEMGARKAEHERSLLTVRGQEAAVQKEKLERDLLHAKSLIEKLSARKETNNDLEEKEKMVERISQAVEEELEKITALKKQIEEQEGKTSGIRIKEKELLQKKGKLEADLSLYQASTENLRVELEERYGLSFDDESLQQIESLANLKEAEHEYKSLRKAIESLGPVNLEAIQEKEECSARFQYLTQQVADLRSSKEELVSIIEELERESRKLYEETFLQVQANFRKNFGILFRGGEADLHLVDSEDVLQAGVEISAKPPGKQMRSISLLSGGEKCMTALAFLFAIFEVKPAPFCVLDEIDAPLDDSNIARFIEVLKQFTDKCQFVIVTHNKRTMAIADTIYGVTMQEKGVSQVLSLEFDKGAEVAEPQLVGSVAD